MRGAHIVFPGIGEVRQEGTSHAWILINTVLRSDNHQPDAELEVLAGPKAQARAHMLEW